jgi:hypothetical protein
MSGGVDNERSSCCGGGGTCSSRCEMGRSCGVDARPRTLARMCGGLDVAVGSIGRGGYLAAMDAHTSALPKCRQKRCTRLPCGPAHWRGRKAETRSGLVCRMGRGRGSVPPASSSSRHSRGRASCTAAEQDTTESPAAPLPTSDITHIPDPVPSLGAIRTETRPPAHALRACWLMLQPSLTRPRLGGRACAEQASAVQSESTAWAAAQRRAGGACAGAPTRAAAFVTDRSTDMDRRWS